MASPFSVFRRNQKVMIAVLGVLAMFAFVFLPIMMESMGSRSQANPVVVTTKYGELRESDINALVTQRRKITSVLADVLGMAGAPPALAHQWVESRIGPATEDAVVTSWVLARHAEEQGVVISDTTVNNFLKELTEDRVKATNFITAFKRSGLSDLQFFNAMRDELAALQLDSIFQTSLRGVTPAERWEYFNRVKQQATIEAVPVAVAGFVDKIDTEPTDAELKTFFEANKDKLPFPNSPESGFREPQRVALEWFKANYDKFTSPEIVTDEEIKERYEKNKELYDPPAKKPEAKDATDAKEPAEPKDTKTPDAKEPTEPKDTKAPEVKEEAKESEKDKKSTDTSATGKHSPFMLTSFLEEEKAADKPETPVAQEKAADKPETPVTQEKPAEKPETPVAQEKPATEAVAPEAKPAEAAPAAQEKTAEKPETPAVQETPAEPKAGLSDATKKRIRQEIAYEKIQKVFGELREQVEQYRREWSKYEVAVIQQRDKKGDKTPPTPPAKPDFEKLARENGLTVDRTGLMTQWEAQSRDVGASLVGGRSPVWMYAFTTMSKFKPEMSGDLKGDLFLFWKTDEAKDRVPKFEDEGVRDRVLLAWKMIQARKFAMEKANELAADAAKKSGQSLKEAFANDPSLQIVTPSPFSWITFGSVALGSAPNAARISDVSGVDMAGEDFMRTVFHLKPGEAGAAFNAPQTVAYVVRLGELTPSWDVLWKQFEVDDFSKYAPASQTDRQAVMRAWLEEIKTSARLKWNRKADQMQESGPRGEE